MNKVAQTNADNRRQFERVTPQPTAPVRVDINGADFIEVINAVDISEGGIRLSVSHRFAGCDVNQPASFIVHLPQPINKFFRFEGHIMHVRDDSFGVRFNNLSAQSRELVKRYVELVSGHSSDAARQGVSQYVRNMLGMLRKAS